MKARKPEYVDPLLWEHLPHGARLALMSKYARTPARRDELEQASLKHCLRQLEQSIKSLERAAKKRGGENEY